MSNFVLYNSSCWNISPESRSNLTKNGDFLSKVLSLVWLASVIQCEWQNSKIFWSICASFVHLPTILLSVITPQVHKLCQHDGISCCSRFGGERVPHCKPFRLNHVASGEDCLCLYCLIHLTYWLFRSKALLPFFPHFQPTSALFGYFSHLNFLSH